MSDLPEDDGLDAPGEPSGDPHRRRSSHLYGLIVSGSVIAAASADYRLIRVGIVLFTTLLIYWAAETFVHWIAARSLLQRQLTGQERRAIIKDGWPLVAAAGTPLLVLFVEGILGMETGRALEIALVVNSLLLFLVGFRMGRAGGLSGLGLWLAGTATGLLGIALVVLKASLH